MQSILWAFCVVVVLNAVNLDALICAGEGSVSSSVSGAGPSDSLDMQI